MAQDVATRVAQAIARLGPHFNDEILKATYDLYVPLQREAPKEGIRVERDIAYGEDERHRLDVFQPQARSTKAAPIVVFFHGGGYIAGARSPVPGLIYDNVPTFFARHGFIGVNATYRLAPMHRWPAGGEDVGRVVAWFRVHGERFGGDPDRVLAFGQSGGGGKVSHLMAMPAAVGAQAQALREQVLIQVVPVLFLYPYVQFLAFFAVHLHGGPQTYGVLATGAGYGGIIALVILTTMGEIRRKGLVLLASVCVYPVSVACFALSPNLPVAMVFLVINGFCNQIYMTMQSTLFLLSAREDMRGRVMGMYSMLNGLGPIGQLGLGLAISVWGPPNAILAFALTAAALLFVAAWTAKTVRAA